MGVEVDIWVWPQLTVAPGATVTLDHWVTGADGISAIDPDHWYWMSAVPDYDPYQFNEGPVLAMGIEIVEQYAYRAYQGSIGPNNAVWRATWHAPSGAEENVSYFRPRLLVAPA
ncbi:MAG: hypothetical protein ACLQOZ_14810 [Acidimicrobiales bacterium]|jgi:hypothetical protein